MQTEKDMELTRGSRYSVAFEKGDAIAGIFKGYSVVGSETALVIESDGTIRFVMVNHIRSITLLESKTAETKKKKEDPGVYYG